MRAIEIYTEANPNPNSMKFVLDFDLLPGENVDYPTPADAKSSPLAQELFKFSFVRRVFISSNFITVTKPEDMDWAELIPILRPFIKQYLEDERPVFSADPIGNIYDENDPEHVKKIKSILDEYVRPAVESDGGAISFHSFDELTGLVKVHLQGSCSGCPSSTITLKQGIENLLTKMVPEVKSVEAEGV